MARDLRIMSPLNILYKYPTASDFKEICDEVLNIKKVEENIGIFEPVLPKYLMEQEVVGNPFSVILKETSSRLKELEKERKEFDKKKLTEYPTDKIIGRAIRNRFNANYQLKKLKYEIDMNEYNDKLLNKEPIFRIPQIPKVKPIRNYDFVCNKRTICRLQLAINEKKEHLLKLDKIVAEEEKKIKDQWGELQKESAVHGAYMKMIGKQSSDALRLVERATFHKNIINNKLKTAHFNKSHLNASCSKLEDEYLRSKSYKEFLINCYNQKDTKLSLERTSLMNDLKLDAIISELNIEGKKSSSESEKNRTFFKDAKRKKSTISGNNSSLQALPLSKLGPFNTGSKIKDVALPKPFNRSELSNLKTMILTGFNNNEYSSNEKLLPITPTSKTSTISQNTETIRSNIFNELDTIEPPIPFKDPQQLVNVFCELEAQNLNLIENVQEQEELCDHMVNKIMKLKDEMQSRVSSIDTHIKNEKAKINDLEQSIKLVEDTEEFLKSVRTLERYENIFYLDNLELNDIDELYDYLYEQVSVLFYSIFTKDDSIEVTTLEMLHKLEVLIDYLYIQLRSFSKTNILAARKKVDERNFEATRLELMEINKTARAVKLQKTIEMSKMPPKYLHGRKVISRSTPFREPVKINAVDLENSKQIEENCYFFE